MTKNCASKRLTGESPHFICDDLLHEMALLEDTVRTTKKEINNLLEIVGGYEGDGCTIQSLAERLRAELSVMTALVHRNPIPKIDWR